MEDSFRQSQNLPARVAGNLGMHDQAAMTPRQRRIVDIVEQQGFATLESLARDFGVSAQSVRRDIIRLDAAGVLQRFHGGVGRRETAVRLGYAEKQRLATQAKARIAARAASLIAPNSAIFLDVGTTVEELARVLAGKAGLRVFTASLAAARLLAGQAGTELFVLGGAVRGVDGSLTGETTLAMLARLRFDVAVIGFSGLDHDGTPMDYDLEKVAVKQAAIAQAERTLMLGDTTKFRKPAVVRLLTDAALTFVTDAQPPGEVLEKMPGQIVVASESVRSDQAPGDEVSL